MDFWITFLRTSAGNGAIEISRNTIMVMIATTMTTGIMKSTVMNTGEGMFPTGRLPKIHAQHIATHIETRLQVEMPAPERILVHAKPDGG